MARLTAEQYADQVRIAREVEHEAVEFKCSEVRLALLDAHERAEAAEARMGMWKLAAELDHYGRDEALGLCHDLEQERDDLLQRLAAADEENALLRGKLSQAEAALSDPKNELAGAEESGGVLHFAHAKHISPAKEEG